jgi:hypothetical protein
MIRADFSLNLKDDILYTKYADMISHMTAGSFRITRCAVSVKGILKAFLKKPTTHRTYIYRGG